MPALASREEIFIYKLFSRIITINDCLLWENKSACVTTPRVHGRRSPCLARLFLSLFSFSLSQKRLFGGLTSDDSFRMQRIHQERLSAFFAHTHTGSIKVMSRYWTRATEFIKSLKWKIVRFQLLRCSMEFTGAQKTRYLILFFRSLLFSGNYEKKSIFLRRWKRREKKIGIVNNIQLCKKSPFFRSRAPILIAGSFLCVTVRLLRFLLLFLVALLEIIDWFDFFGSRPLCDDLMSESFFFAFCFSPFSQLRRLFRSLLLHVMLLMKLNIGGFFCVSRFVSTGRFCEWNTCCSLPRTSRTLQLPQIDGATWMLSIEMSWVSGTSLHCITDNGGKIGSLH